MCGIFAYSGDRTDAPKLVIEGLKCLEYRGYDSWGVAYKTDNNIQITKEVGKIGEVPENLITTQSNLAMGHSRWATHGGVTKINAHPHQSEDKRITIIHNGICENYLELKEYLVDKGHKFISETDTEVIANLISEHFKTHNFQDAVKLALKEVEGRYAIVVINNEDNTIIAARKGSPLIIGVGENDEFFIASDIPAFLKHTKKVIYLDDHQMATIANKEIIFYDTQKTRRHPKNALSKSNGKHNTPKKATSPTS